MWCLDSCLSLALPLRVLLFLPFICVRISMSCFVLFSQNLRIFHFASPKICNCNPRAAKMKASQLSLEQISLSLVHTCRTASSAHVARITLYYQHTCTRTHLMNNMTLEWIFDVMPVKSEYVVSNLGELPGKTLPGRSEHTIHPPANIGKSCEVPTERIWARIYREILVGTSAALPYGMAFKLQIRE